MKYFGKRQTKIALRWLEGRDLQTLKSSVVSLELCMSRAELVASAGIIVRAG